MTHYELPTVNQYVTRDTYNFAFKATAVEQEIGTYHTLEDLDAGITKPPTHRIIRAIFKAPVTDTFSKKSHRGIPVVYMGRVGQEMTGKLYGGVSESR